jgi:hypothetical protein
MSLSVLVVVGRSDPQDTHIIFTKSRLTRLKKVDAKAKQMEASLTEGRFTSNVLPITKTQMAVCLSSAHLYL